MSTAFPQSPAAVFNAIQFHRAQLSRQAEPLDNTAEGPASSLIRGDRRSKNSAGSLVCHVKWDKHQRQRQTSITGPAGPLYLKQPNPHYLNEAVNKFNRIVR